MKNLKWEVAYQNFNGGEASTTLYCPSCGFTFVLEETYHSDDYNYCPKCGKKLKETKEKK